MQGTFTTDSVDQRHRFAFWRDLVCDVFVNLECCSDAPHSFNARMRFGMFGPARVVEAESDAIRAVRSRTHISKGREDDFLVVVQRTGQTAVEQDGVRSVLSDGNFAVLDAEQPYSLDMSAGASTVWLQFPRAELLGRVGTHRPLLARGLPGQRGASAMFSHMVQTLASRMHEFSHAEAAGAGTYGLDLLGVALAGVTSGRASRSSARLMSLNRLKTAINRHLRDPDLTPSRAAQIAGLSVRHANRLLASQGTSLERFIWSRRLECCRAALQDGALAHLSIGEIAYSWGFNDLGHFSRAFRKKFGASPSELRKAANS